MIHPEARRGTLGATRCCSTPPQNAEKLDMRYLIAWLLGVPLSVLVIIWLIWGG